MKAKVTNLSSKLYLLIWITGKKIQPMLTRNPEVGTQPDVSVPMTVSIAKLKEICSAYNPLQLTCTTEGSYSKQRKEATIPRKSIEKATNKVTRSYTNIIQHLRSEQTHM